MKIIASKMSVIMSECQYLQKQGVNEFHNYRFVQANDVIKAVRESLVRHKVALAVSYDVVVHGKQVNKNGKEETQAIVKASVTFIDVESGESITSSALGMGQDIGDKAVMKAETAAFKYCLLHTFAIETGDDPEADSSVDERMGADRQWAPAATSKQPPSDSLKATVPAADKAVDKCVDCGKEIDSNVASFSKRMIGMLLCRECQAHYKKVS